jgi:hypothetical protein
VDSVFVAVMLVIFHIGLTESGITKIPENQKMYRKIMKHTNQPIDTAFQRGGLLCCWVDAASCLWLSAIGFGSLQKHVMVL